MDLQQTLQQGITAAQAGQKQEARQLLTAVVEADESQLEAWLWLSQVVDSLGDKAICLENILTLDPANQFAEEELAQVRASQARLYAPIYALGDEDPPPGTVSVPAAATIPVTTEYPYEDEFDDEWLCPYCTRPTQPQHRTCLACRQPLVFKKRVKEERTVWLWRGIFLQIVVIFLLVSAATAYFAVALKLNGIASPFPFIPLYFWQPVNQPADIITTVLTLFPRWVFWSVVVVSLYSLGLMVLLYVRLPYGHFLYLVNSGITLVLGIAGILLFYDSTPLLIVSVVGVFLGLGQLLITLNLWNDFTFQEGRLQLRIDRGAKNHQSLFISGRKYSKLGMWGLAVIHFRRAISREGNIPAYHLALASAYMNINRYELADKTLSKAEQLGNTVEVLRLRKRLKALTHKN